ncbi:hypothetical protein TWF281_007462 [Arthrobotrys megalospora]
MTEETSPDGPWPLGFDMGADLQFIHEDYCRPPARVTDTTGTEANGGTEDENKSEAGEDDDEDNNEVEETEDNEDNEDNEEDAEGENEDPGAQQDEIDYKKQALLRISNGTPTEYYESPDLKVVLKNERGTYTFLVSSHALSIASKVWKFTIHPQGFKELETETLGSYGTVKVMRLEDDDVLALDLIFQILHLRTDEILSDVSFGFLRRIAVVSDKYECGKALNPWPKMWMKPYEGLAIVPQYEDWIFIAKTLQPKNTKMKVISTRLVLEVSSKSECGKYFRRDVAIPVGSKVEIDLELLPDRFLAYVTQERSKAVHTIVTMLRQFVSDIASANQYLTLSGSIRSKFCENEVCSDLAVGSLIRNLKTSRLWPLLSSDHPHNWHGSVSALVRRIEGLKMTTLIQRITLGFGVSSKTSPAQQASGSGTTATTSNPVGAAPVGGTRSTSNPVTTAPAVATGSTFGSTLNHSSNLFGSTTAAQNPFGSSTTASSTPHLLFGGPFGSTSSQGRGAFGSVSSRGRGTFGSVSSGAAPSTSTVLAASTANTVSNEFSTMFGSPSTSSSTPTSQPSTSTFGSNTTGGATSGSTASTPGTATQPSSSVFGSGGTKPQRRLQFSGFGKSNFASNDTIYATDSHYEHPGFEEITYLGEYRPCPSAFALGDLITKCRKVIEDISAGGYEEET